MLTVAYCRVSTEEQAAEGYSINGQAEKLRAYADLHDLGTVTVIDDPGLSGKNMKRPGLQRLLAMVEAGHVDNVLLWRLDRLSRDLGDLIALVKTFETNGVALHSFTEQLDLTSPTGRMFFHILGSFAQYYRETLAENVTMGTDRARAEGRWTNRPPRGYEFLNGLLTPNADAATVRRIFKMRADGASYNTIEAATGVTHSSVIAILKNRAYLGEMPHKDSWVPGIHEPLITEAEFEAVHRGRVPGRKRGRDLMSGRVICGACNRRMSIESNGQGQHQYRCKHRGSSCGLPGRSNRGLTLAAVHAMGLLCDDELRDAIRQYLGERRQPDAVRRGRTPGTTEALGTLYEQRRKLLQLHYDGHISGDQFGEEQARLTTEIENLEHESTAEAQRRAHDDDLAARFEQLAHLLDQLDLDQLWEHATDTERRTLLDELVHDVTVQRDRLTVTLHGAPPLNVAFSEVGLKDSDLSRVGGGT